MIVAAELAGGPSFEVVEPAPQGRHARLMGATLGLPQESLVAGARLPDVRDVGVRDRLADPLPQVGEIDAVHVMAS